MPIAEAQIETEGASRYLVQLCRHLAGKAEGLGGVQARVDCSDTQGVADFGWARCTMRADPNTLTLLAEAGDEEDLQLVLELFARALEKFGAGDDVSVNWQGAGPAAYPGDARHGIARMRQFHRRARSSTQAD